METLIIKAIYKGDHSMFEKGKEYSIIVTKIGKGWKLITIDNDRKTHYYHSLKEFIGEWSNISNL